MSDDAKCAAPTPAATLEQHITDSHFPKNEAEWWAHHEIIRLREENARLREAVGLMTTMAPFMELDVNDPVGTAKTVWAEQEKLFQENARLRAALKPFVPKTQVIDAAIPDTRPIDVMVRAGELRAAAAAIREGGKEG